MDHCIYDSLSFSGSVEYIRLMSDARKCWLSGTFRNFTQWRCHGVVQWSHLGRCWAAAKEDLMNILHSWHDLGFVVGCVCLRRRRYYTQVLVGLEMLTHRTCSARNRPIDKHLQVSTVCGCLCAGTTTATPSALLVLLLLLLVQLRRTLLFHSYRSTLPLICQRFSTADVLQLQVSYCTVYNLI